ncbi:hypothetical protein NHJ13051_006723 [Beauveria bassiana]
MKFSALPLVAAAVIFTTASAAPAMAEEATANKLVPHPEPVLHNARQLDESRTQEAGSITKNKSGRAEAQGLPDRCVWKNGNRHCPFIGHGHR